MEAVLTTVVPIIVYILQILILGLIAVICTQNPEHIGISFSLEKSHRILMKLILTFSTR